MHPLEIAVKYLSKRKATFFDAETIRIFAIEKLERQDTLIATNLAKTLKERIDSRRNATLMYLKNLSMAEELDLLLSKEKHFQDFTVQSEVSFEKLVENEMKIFETLEKLFCCLKTIPPTSVKSERAFLSASFFATKMRGNLSDITFSLQMYSHFIN